jgi:6-pyruvoyltetrahydropterin/6-carboxytetrahydropterin synthase
MAHRVPGHANKCRHLHGHRYVADITVSMWNGGVHSDAVSHVGGMVEDFGDLKGLCDQAFLGEWDHACALWRLDPAAAHLAADTSTRERLVLLDHVPTAEVLAAEIFGRLGGCLASSLVLERVRVQETPNCWAEVTR